MTRIFAHRGFDGRYPGNTFLAFEKAVEAGCDGIETDVRLTRDGHLILFHDDRLDRATDGSGYVKRRTLAEIKRLDAAGPYAGAVPRQEIPTLEEYLKWAARLPVVTNLEIKRGYTEPGGIEEKVLEAVARCGAADRVIYASFNPRSMARVRALDKRAHCALLVEALVDAAGALAASLRLNAVNPRFQYATQGNVARLKARGLSCAVWPPETPEDILRMARIGVQSITTGRPDIARKTLSSHDQSP